MFQAKRIIERFEQGAPRSDKHVYVPSNQLKFKTDFQRR